MRYACPKCKSTNLRVVVETWATLHQNIEGADPDAFETDTNDSLAHEWDENSPMECMDCDHSDVSSGFEVDTEEQRGG